MERTPEIEASGDGLPNPSDGFAGRQEPGDAFADTIRVFGVFRGWIHFAFFGDVADFARGFKGAEGGRGVSLRAGAGSREVVSG